MLTLGGDDGLAGGLALGRVEGIWMIHCLWGGEVGGREGWTEGLLYVCERRRGSRTAQWVKDPERTKCAKSLEMLYCRSGGQDEIGSPHNNIPLP